MCVWSRALCIAYRSSVAAFLHIALDRGHQQPDHYLVMQNMRVDFQFDTAAFAFNALPFKIPYPVPFKLLGDETKVFDAPCDFICTKYVSCQEAS